VPIIYLFYFTVRNVHSSRR